MKISISLADRDLSILDDFARRSGLPTRSAAVARAIRLLRYADLEQDYAAAWEEWGAAGDDASWEPAIGDGLTDASG